MKKIMRRTAGLGVMGTVIAAVSVMIAAPAQAVDFYSGVPPKATSVTTVKSYNTGHGTLQLRRGTYNGKKYMWARFSSPDSKLNKGWDLRFSIAGRDGCLAGDPRSSIKDIDTTTYTSASVYNAKCSYAAVAEERDGSGYYLIDWMA